MKKENNKNEKCIFCEIVKGNIPSTDVYEDRKVKAFLDINPVTHGHTLVISKEHFPTMTDLPESLNAHCFNVAKHLMKKIKKSCNADFVTLAVVGVDVNHFHIHLIPRKYSDKIPVFWPTKKYRQNDMEKTAEKIRSEISKK